MANGNPVVRDIGRAALDQFGIDPAIVAGINDPGTLISSGNVPRTSTRTSHGLTLRVAGGRVIGAVNAIAHTHSRSIEEEWEIDAGAHGASPADLVPQNVTGRQLVIGRYDLFVRNVEEVFNLTGEVVILSDQFRPFTLRTIWNSPVGIVLGGRRVYEYTGCWFTDIGRNAATTDDRIINVSATIRYQTRRRVL